MGADRPPPVIGDDRVTHQQRCLCEQPREMGEIGVRELEHRGAANGVRLFIVEQRAQRLGLTVAVDHQDRSPTASQRNDAVEGPVMGGAAIRYSRASGC